MNRYIPPSIHAAALLLGAAVFSSSALAAPNDAPAWIAKSNAHAQLLLDVLSKSSPEFASSTGIPGFDDKVVDLSIGVNERNRANTIAARDELAKRLLAESDPLVRQDIEILIKTANDNVATSLLNEKLALPYADIGQLVFFGEFGLLQDQVDAARRPAALARLKRYTGLEPGTTSTFANAKARYEEAAKNPKLLGPFKDRVAQNLANAARYATGIRGLYAKYGLDKLDGAPAALDEFEKQLNDYNAWVKATVLPRAREDFRLPDELYADNLKQVGLDIPPQELIHKAMLAYGEIRNEMATLAPLIAKAHNFADSDYRAVIRELKKDQVAKENVEAYYATIIAQIEDI